MFAIIETNGATHILIHVPGDTAAKSLPTLAAMLENNAVFINQSWRDLKQVTPGMSINLGDKYRIKDNEEVELVIAASVDIVGEEFELATPTVMVNNKAALAKKQAVIDRLNKEVSFKDSEMKRLQERIEALNSDIQGQE